MSGDRELMGIEPRCAEYIRVAVPIDHANPESLMGWGAHRHRHGAMTVFLLLFSASAKI